MLKLNTSSNGGTSLTPDTVADTGAILPRADLYQRIGVPPKLPITFVIAPAGYGKSTVVTQWANQQQHPVAWVSLTRGTNSISAMTTLIARAVANCVHDEDPAALSSMDELVARLHNVTTDREPVTLVFDDYHLIENRDVHDAMNALLLLRPAKLSIVFLSRQELPLALGRLRAEGLIQQFTAQDLAFTPDEVADVANRVAGTALDSTQAALLAERTEGWIAGIRLALASLDLIDPANTTSIVDTWSAQAWLDDYVVEEVLNGLPADLREFVFGTVILAELTPELCDAVLETDSSARLLREIGQRLVFVRPVGDGLAYHSLFAESVERLASRHQTPHSRHDLHHRAAAWYSAHGNYEQAIAHAITAESWDLAREGLHALCQPFVERDISHSLIHWLEQLPQHVLLADPVLARWYIAALQYTGRLREVIPLAARMDPIWRESGDPALLGYATSCQIMFAMMDGNLDLAYTLLHDALDFYPADYYPERLHTWSAIMQIEMVRGNDDAVEDAFREAELCRRHLPQEQIWWLSTAEPDKANYRALRGDLAAASQIYQEILRHLPAIYRVSEGRTRFRLAALYLEQNLLDEAMEQARHVLENIESLPYHVWHPEALLLVARVYEATGDLEQVEALLRRARALYYDHGGDHNLHRLEALEVSMWLQTDRAALAREWMRRVNLSDYHGVRLFGDPDSRLAIIQIMVESGEAGSAEAALRPLVEDAREKNRTAELVPLLIWQCICLLEAGKVQAARETLKLALAEGRPGGFVRAFLPPTYDLRPFLRRSIRHLGAADATYVRMLVGTSQQGSTSRTITAAPPSPLASPYGELLSPREVDVIELLREGATNAEIASRLHITLRTTKKHVSNILGKLGLTSRMEAAMWANNVHNT